MFKLVGYIKNKQIWLGLMLGLSGLTLGCGLLSRFTGSDQQPTSVLPATKVAALNHNSQLVAEAYTKIETLPGYHLESQHFIAGNQENPLVVKVVKTYDSAGNVHILVETTENQGYERYIVDGFVYQFDVEYKGWVNLGKVSAEMQQSGSELNLAGLAIAVDPAQLMAQFGAVPTQARSEMLNQRPATHYRLQHIFTEVAEAFNQEPPSLPTNLSGTLWIDEETGALLKSEIILYEAQTGEQTQKHSLEISNIGRQPPLTAPSPIVDPEAIVAATATAQAWTVLSAEILYRGTPTTFDFIPIAANQIANSSPRQAEVQVLIRRLPPYILLDDNIDPFLSQVRHQLTLSIPNRNLVVTSSGYHLETIDQEQAILKVRYLFNADLENFAWTELILAGQGNPQFAPVPVE